MTDDTIARIRAIAALADVTDERFTDAQVAKVAEFEAADVPAEVAEIATVDRVARALWRSDTVRDFPDADLGALWPKVLSHFPDDAEAYRRLARAALAAMSEPNR